MQSDKFDVINFRFKSGGTISDLINAICENFSYIKATKTTGTSSDYNGLFNERTGTMLYDCIIEDNIICMAFPW